MKTMTRSRLLSSVLIGITVALCAAGSASAAAAPEDRILPADQYTSEKARTLAKTYRPAMLEFNSRIYHCLPWVEVQKGSIGFFKPKGAEGDARYMSVRLYIEQEPSPQFSGLAVEERASSMFSRYVGPMVKRMASTPGLMNDSSVDGFTVILEWLKQAPGSPSARPIHETIAVFITKPAAREYLTGMVAPRDFAAKTRVMGWDGETALGQLRLSAWEDNFLSTFKVKNYEVQPGITCP
jgi:hypothetical protein